MNNLRILKSIPVEPKLPDRRAKCAQFQITTTPIGQRGDLLGIRVEPFAVGATPSTRQFLATKGG